MASLRQLGDREWRSAVSVRLESVRTFGTVIRVSWKLTFRTQPGSNRVTKAFFMLLQSLDSLIVAVGFRKLFVSSQGSIAHEPFHGFNATEMGRLKQGRNFIFDNLRMITRSLCPISSLLTPDTQTCSQVSFDCLNIMEPFS